MPAPVWLLLGLVGTAIVLTSLGWLADALTTGVVHGSSVRRLVYFHADPGGYTFYLIKRIMQTLLGAGITAVCFAQAFCQDRLEAHLNRKLEAWSSALRAGR